MLSRKNLIVSGLSAAALGAFGYGLWPKLGAYSAEVARQRKLPALDPQMAELIRMVTLAANGHNTQPWKFQLTDGHVAILPDFARRTAVVDPDDHHLCISLGCAVENLTIAAKASGWRAHTTIEKEGDIRISIDLGRGMSDIKNELEKKSLAVECPTLHSAVDLE